MEYKRKKKRNKLYEFRVLNYLTLHELADLMETSHSNISQMERAENLEHRLTLKFLKNLSKNFGMDIHELIDYFMGG